MMGMEKTEGTYEDRPLSRKGGFNRQYRCRECGESATFVREWWEGYTVKRRPLCEAHK